jgi:hypothetical protein
MPKQQPHLQRTIIFDKSTKSAYRYREDADDAPAIGTIYIKKYLLPEPPPNNLTVKIYGIEPQ